MLLKAAKYEIIDDKRSTCSLPTLFLSTPIAWIPHSLELFPESLSPRFSPHPPSSIHNQFKAKRSKDGYFFHIPIALLWDEDDCSISAFQLLLLFLCLVDLPYYSSYIVNQKVAAHHLHKIATNQSKQMRTPKTSHQHLVMLPS